jgi:hypothetical protein
MFTCCNLLLSLNRLCNVVKTTTSYHSWFLLVDVAKLREGTISFVMSVRMEQLSSQWTDFYEIWYLSIFRQSCENIHFFQNPTRIMGTSHVDLCTFMIISCWILLRMRNVCDKRCRKVKTHNFTFNKVFYFSENRTIYKIMCNNILQLDKLQKTI